MPPSGEYLIAFSMSVSNKLRRKRSSSPKISKPAESSDQIRRPENGTSSAFFRSMTTLHLSNSLIEKLVQSHRGA